MKNLDIHRDMPEPSMEDMQKHMNFEEVLNRASNSPATPKKGVNKSWIIGGAAVTVAIVATMMFLSQNGASEKSYHNVAMENEPIEKIEAITPEETEIAFHSETESNTPEEVGEVAEPNYDDFYPPIEPIKIEYYKPLLVSSIPFIFDESFGLKEQWQSFPELSIYENLSFQPIDKAQQSMLKLTWDKVDFKKDEGGQFYLLLYKGDQAVICPVTPVFEKDPYLVALEVYQEHQP